MPFGDAKTKNPATRLLTPYVLPSMDDAHSKLLKIHLLLFLSRDNASTFRHNGYDYIYG